MIKRSKLFDCLTLLYGAGLLASFGAYAQEVTHQDLLYDDGAQHSLVSTETDHAVLVNSGSTLAVGTGSNLVMDTTDGNTDSRIELGNGGSGTLNLNGGTVTFHIADSAAAPGPSIGRIWIGGGVDTTGGNGTLNMSAGTIQFLPENENDTTPNYGAIAIGRGANVTGNFNQSGGVTSFQSSGAMDMGAAGGTGTYTLSNDAVFDASHGGMTMYIGSGSATSEGSGTVSVLDQAQFTMTTGTIAGGQLYVGDARSTGTVIQDGAGSVVTLGLLNPVLFGSNVNNGGGVNGGGTGSYVLSAGTLNVNNVGGSGRLVFGAAAGGSGIFTLSGGAAHIASNLVVAETAGSTGLIDQSGGTLSLTGGAKLSFGSGNGTYRLLGGSLLVGGTDGLSGTGSLTFGDATLGVQESDLTSGMAATLAAGTRFTFDTQGFNANWSGVLSGEGALTKAGNGTLTLSAADTYTGITTIDGGTLALSGAGSIGNSGGLVDNGTFDISGMTAAGISLPNLSGSGTIRNGTNALTVGSDNSDTHFSGTIVNDYNGWDPAYGTFTKVGSGTLTIDGATIEGGESYIDGGAMAQTSGDTKANFLSVGSGVTDSQPNVGILNVSGGTLAFTTALQVGDWGGTGTVNQTGGQVMVTAGCGDPSHCDSISIGNQGGTGIYNISGGTLSFESGIFDFGRNDTRNPSSNGTLNLSGNGAVTLNSGEMILGDNLASVPGATARGTGTLNQSGGMLAFNGSASLYLAGAGNGTYNFNGGTLQIGGSSLQGSYNSLGGTYAFNLGGGTIQVIGSTLDTGVDATLVDGSTSTIDTGEFGAKWSGTLSGNGALTKTGNSTLTLTKADTYTGITTIAEGTLALSGAGSISGSAGLVDNGIFDISALTGTVANTPASVVLPNLSGSGTVTNGTNVLIVGSDNSDSRFSGTIANTGHGWDPAYGMFAKVGSGTLTIDGATITGGESYIVDGAMAQTDGDTSIDYLAVGSGASSNGALNVSAGTITFGTGLEVGSWGGSGTLTQTGGNVVVDAGCEDLAHCASLSIGNQGGTGSYDLSGGTLSFDSGFLVLGRNDAANPASTGVLNLSGTGSVTVSNSTVIVGDNLAMTGGASAGTGVINQSGGTLAIDGTSSLYLSGSGNGTYNLNGGTLQIGGSSLHGSYNNLGGTYAFNLGGGTIQVIGSTLDTGVDATLVGGSTSTIDTGEFGAKWSGILSGDGALTKTGDSTLTLTGANTYTGITTIAGGTLALSGAGSIMDSAGLVDNGIFDISAVAPLSRAVTEATLAKLSGTGTVILGANTLVVGTATGTDDSSFSGAITGTGDLDKMGSGTLTLNGISDYSGNTDVQAGTLIVGGDEAHAGASIAGNVNVDADASLGGHGHVGGDVSVQMDGHLAPGNSIGTLNIGGDLNLAQGSQLDFEFGANGQSDSVAVAGDLNAHGATLNIDGDLGPGLYTLFTWGGELDDADGITLNGAPGNGVSIQTLADDKRINLINTDGLTLNYWNGNGLANADRMGGGDGTWSATSKNWTDATGSVSAPMQPQPGFAIFAGAAGHVSVDDGNGAVSVTGMQFFSDGYHLDGGSLTLVNDPQQSDDGTPVIQVGDGTAVGAGYVATIDNVLAGNNGFDKTDLGTLLLTGDNTYTGHTVLSDGTVSVSSDRNLGDASSVLDFEGGTLRVTGTDFQNTMRTILWGDAGGGFDIADAGNSFSVTQALGGNGSLTKLGDGTLILGGANSYSGGTIITGGALQGDTNSLQGNVLDNARLVFDQGSDGTFAGSVSGSGSLSKDGSGTLVLTGANSYGGGTTIDAGTLQGDTKSLQGNITDNASLVFDQDNSGTFVGTISGTGSLGKNGSGTVILTGANSYSGGTAIDGGTLQGDTRSLQGDIIDNAHLVFDQDSDGAFAGVVSGSGSLGKGGSGTLTLTGANSYSGGTAIDGGTLQGDTDSLQGDITDNAHLVFDQGSDGTFAGAISGSGSLGKSGNGTLILTGANSYNGGTVIDGGTLQGDTHSLQGNVTDNARLVFDQDSDGTFVGAISGSGALGKDGSGTLVLTGANSYNGGTAIDAGTLQGDTHSLQGHIVDNASLVFDQDSDGIFAGSLSGSGRLTKSGAGTLIINGSNPLDGDTTVTDGTLVVGDDSHAGASLGGLVTVNSSAALGGIGTIGGLDLFGAVMPGNSIGTLTINGNAVFEKGSSYRIEAMPNGESDRIVASGKVSILGGSALALGSDGDWAPRTDYTILTAADGIDGTFDSVSSSLAFLTPSLSYSANAVDMTLERNNISFASVAQTANQRATGGAADALGFGNTLYDALVKLDAPTARHAFDQLSGEVHASTRTALIDDSRYLRDAISNHVLGLDGERNVTGANGVSAWTSVWGHWGDHGSDGNAASMSANGSGLLVGADLPVGSSEQLGAVVGSGQSSVQVDARNSTAHAQATHLGAYGSVQGGRFQLQGGVAYSWQNVNSYRSVAFGDFADAAGARYHADTVQAYADGSYTVDLAHGTLAPFLDLARVQLHTDAFRESGGAGLAVAAQSSAVNYATLGLRGSVALDAARGIQAHAGLGWQHAWGDIAERNTMQFAGSSDTFAVAGTPVARNAGALNAGVSWALTQKVSVDASYNGQFASHAKDQSAHMSLTWRF